MRTGALHLMPGDDDGPPETGLPAYGVPRRAELFAATASAAGMASAAVAMTMLLMRNFNPQEENIYVASIGVRQKTLSPKM